MECELLAWKIWLNISRAGLVPAVPVFGSHFKVSSLSFEYDKKSMRRKEPHRHAKPSKDVVGQIPQSKLNTEKAGEYFAPI